MKKAFLILLIGIIGLINVYADGFKDMQNVYYYNKVYTFKYEDATPPISDSCYFAASFDNGNSWEKISNVYYWKTTETKITNYFVDTVASSVSIGLFANPNGSWVLYDTYNTSFSYAEYGQFLNLPSVIYNGGKYSFKLNLMSDQLPEYLRLLYSLDGGLTWKVFDIIGVRNEVIYTFENTKIDNAVIFRLVYDNDYTIALSPVIPYQYRDTYFTFKTVGGYKDLSDKSDIFWEKSNNFYNVKLEIFLNDILVSTTSYITDGIEINFTSYGKYKIHGTVEDDNFKIERDILFNVGDPCELVKIENDSLKQLNDVLITSNQCLLDSIVTLNDFINRQGSDIANLNRIIYNLNRYIEDSTQYDLVYKNGDITNVESVIYGINIKEPRYNVDGEILTVSLDESYNDGFTWWMFDVSGNMIASKYYFVFNGNITIKKPASGFYLIYTKNGFNYNLYKITI